MGTIQAICYRNGGPPDLPLINFDHYTGPTLSDGTVPITPSRLQQASLGLTLNQVVVDVGKKEFSCGLTFIEFVT